MKPTKADGRRGPMRFHIEKELVHVWLGEPHDPESEHMTTFHQGYLKDMIAVLRMAEDTLRGN